MKRALTHRDWLIALVLCLGTTLVLLLAGRNQGFTRDEGYYFDAGEQYWAWFGEVGDAVAAGHPERAFNRRSIDRWFANNHEHPVLMKTLYGISWRVFHRCDCPRQGGRHPVFYPHKHRTLGLLSEAEAFRLPANLFAGIMVALVYLFGLQAWSRRAGLIAAMLSLAAPRFFFHAQLSCFDAPVVTTWLATIYAYWRSLDEPRWAWKTGLFFGLALATKHNGFFLPAILLAHYLWVRRDAWLHRRVPPFPLAFLWLAILGPLVEIGHWPWLWFDTVARLREYLAFHLHHVYYNMEFLGANYNKPPFPKSFPFVMTALTLPATTIALALGGSAWLVGRWWLRRRIVSDQPFAPATWTRPAAGRATSPGLLVGLNAVFPMAIISFTGAPIFGATKHWLAALPFLALLAGVGADRLAILVAEQLPSLGRRPRLFSTVLVLLAVMPAAAETWRSHPYGLSHYNLLAGGPAGGASLGMNRQFWGYSTRGILPWLNAQAPRGAPVYWHDTNQPILNMNVREQLLRSDIGNTGLEEPGVRAAKIAMVIHEMHFNKYEYWMWDFFHTTRPSLVLTYEGVPLVTVYERSRGAKP